MLPPSRMGMGMRLRMPRLRLRAARRVMTANVAFLDGAWPASLAMPDDTLELLVADISPVRSRFNHDEDFEGAALCKLCRGSERLREAHLTERPFLPGANADDPGGFPFFRSYPKLA